MSSDETRREYKLEHQRAWRANMRQNPEKLERYLAKARKAALARYHTLKNDPEYVAKERARKRELGRKRWADPVKSEAIKSNAKVARQKPENKAKQAERMAAWRSSNKNAIREYQAHWKQENAEAVREYSKEYSRTYSARPDVKHAKRISNYQLTMAQFSALWAQQDGKCSICEVGMLPVGRSANASCIDHNHDTGEVRGLLCRACNHGIGHLKDDPSVLRRAAEYLETHGHYGHKKVV